MRSEFHAMGTRITMVLEIEGAEARRLIQMVRGWFQGWEAIYSRFLDNSELNTLNQNQGKWLTVSMDMASLLEAALQAARETEGLVTPSILPALEKAGYDRPFNQITSEKIPGFEAANENATHVISPLPISLDWEKIEYDSQNKRIRMPEGMKIDLGGFAKGWSADQVVSRLARYCPVMLDAGGDIAINSPRQDGSAWKIAVPGPDLAGENLLVLPFKNEFCGPVGIGTSGTTKHRWLTDGKWMHHIIDPRTRKPAESDLKQVTVIAPTALEAEVAAKMVLISGSQAGLAWLEKHPDLSAILQFE